MTEALATRPVSAVMALSREQRATLKNTICKELTDSELDLFISFCQARNFDPLGKFVAPFKSSGKMSLVTYIDAKRAVAHRSGLFDGMEGPFYCGEDGAWKDVWLAKARPTACKVVVYRKGCTHPFTAIMLASEYRGGAVAGQMPVHMLGKATESLALSKAFPEDLGQLYTDDEIPDARGAVASLTVDTTATPVKREAQPARLTLAAVTKAPEPEVVVEQAQPEPASDDFGGDSPANDIMPEAEVRALYARAMALPAPHSITKEEFVDICGPKASEVTRESFEIMSEVVARREERAKADAEA